MERVQRDSRDHDNDRGEVAAVPRTTAPSSASGAADGGTPLSSAMGATPDAGWEADVSLLAALGIFVGSTKPGGPGGEGHHAGNGGQAKPAALPGAATPPKGQPQGRVTPEIKKELENKKLAKAHPSTGQAQGGAAGAQPASGEPAVPGGQASQPSQGSQGNQTGGAPSAPGAPKPSGPGSGDPDPTEAHNIERLIAVLDSDADPAHRRAAVHALGKLRSPQARAALEKAARDKDPAIAKAAAALLAAR